MNTRKWRSRLSWIPKSWRKALRLSLERCMPLSLSLGWGSRYCCVVMFLDRGNGPTEVHLLLILLPCFTEPIHLPRGLSGARGSYQFLLHRIQTPLVSQNLLFNQRIPRLPNPHSHLWRRGRLGQGTCTSRRPIAIRCCQCRRRLKLCWGWSFPCTWRGFMSIVGGCENLQQPGQADPSTLLQPCWYKQ